MSFKSSFGAVEDTGGSWLGFGTLILIWIWSLVFYTPLFQILSILIFKMQRASMSFNSSFCFLNDDGGSQPGFGILILIRIWSLVSDIFMIWILALHLDFEGAKTSRPCNYSPGALDDAGGSWLGFGILILIWIWSLVFDTHMFQILALYLDFEGAKFIHVL